MRSTRRPPSAGGRSRWSIGAAGCPFGWRETRGRAPDEFDELRESAFCSGAGGLLPCTMPEVARAITDARLEAHARSGGGSVVTACASSLIAMRKRARKGVRVDDLVTWIARSAA